jgi:hypothetical protein
MMTRAGLIEKIRMYKPNWALEDPEGSDGSLRNSTTMFCAQCIQHRLSYSKHTEDILIDTSAYLRY